MLIYKSTLNHSTNQPLSECVVRIRLICWMTSFMLRWSICPWLMKGDIPRFMRRMIEDHPSPQAVPWFGEPLTRASGAAQVWILIFSPEKMHTGIVVTLLCKFYNLAGKHPHAHDFEKNTRDRSIAINRFREGSKNRLNVHYYYRLVNREQKTGF